MRLRLPILDILAPIAVYSLASPVRLGRLATALLLVAISALDAAAQGSQPATPTIEVLIVGTYHFDNPGQDLVNPEVPDVLSPAKQAEIADVVEGLARFRPTKIAVEAQRGGTARLDSLYRGVLAGTRSLGRNEVEQLGFRLAHRLRHGRVYPIDAPGEFPIEPVFAYAERHDTAALRRLRGALSQVAAEHDSLQRQATVRQILRFENAPARLAWSHGFYLELARIGGGDSLVGAALLAAWYERYVRIFVNLLRLAEPGDRILVFFGAGHAPPLREMVRSAPGFRLVEALDFL
jgi:hypothetical protein